MIDKKIDMAKIWGIPLYKLSTILRDENKIVMELRSGTVKVSIQVLDGYFRVFN